MGNRQNSNSNHRHSVCFNCNKDICDTCSNVPAMHAIRRVLDDSGHWSWDWDIGCLDCCNKLRKTPYYI